MHIMTNGRPLLRGALTITLLASGSAAVPDSQYEIFSNICYRRKPVVSYITRTKAWKEGRRDILDYGCGSGALSLALAEEGAGRVVAVDLKPGSVRAANQRLLAFSNASARGPRFGAEAMGFPGLIAFTDQFDTVVSYMGALTDGTSDKEKIAARDATDRAVRACRDGGSVIVAECSGTLGGLLSLPLLTVVVALLVATPGLQHTLNRLLILVTGMVIVGFLAGIDGVLLSFAARSIATSIATKKVGIGSVIWSLYYVFDFGQPFLCDRRKMSQRVAQMEKAGLGDVRATRKPSLRMVERLNDSAVAKLSAFIKNWAYHPGSVIIYEGVKKSSKVEKED